MVPNYLKNYINGIINKMLPFHNYSEYEWIKRYNLEDMLYILYALSIIEVPGR